MADSYYYQDNGQICGPLTPAALKQLANEGVIGESTPVRKGEQGAWYQAGTIAGLVPPKPAQPTHLRALNRMPRSVRGRRSERRKSRRRRSPHKLWFLDLKFSRFFTPKLVGALWAIYLCLVVILFSGQHRPRPSNAERVVCALAIIVEFIAWCSR